MIIWIDIDKKEDVPFFNSLIKELKERDHHIIITSPRLKKIKDNLREHGLASKEIGYSFSFFGLLQEPLNYIRAVLLMNYLDDKDVEISISIGSKPMIYFSAKDNIPIIHITEDYEKRPHVLYFAFDKSFFLISDSVPDQHLIETGYELERVARFKGNLKIKDADFDSKIIKDIVNQIEALSKRLGSSVTA